MVSARYLHLHQHACALAQPVHTDALLLQEFEELGPGGVAGRYPKRQKAPSLGSHPVKIEDSPSPLGSRELRRCGPHRGRPACLPGSELLDGVTKTRLARWGSCAS